MFMRVSFVKGALLTATVLLLASCDNRSNQVKELQASVLTASSLDGRAFDDFVTSTMDQQIGTVSQFGTFAPIQDSFSSAYQKYSDAKTSFTTLSELTEPVYEEPAYNGPFHFVGTLIAPVKDGGFILRDLKKKYFYVTGVLGTDLLHFDDNLNLSLYLSSKSGSTGVTLQGVDIYADNVGGSSQEDFESAQADYAKEVKDAKTAFKKSQLEFANKEKSLSKATKALDEARKSLISTMKVPVVEISTQTK